MAKKKKGKLYFISTYAGLKLMKWLFVILPWPLAIKLGEFGCATAAKLMKKRFNLNMKSISLAFPEKSQQEVREICLKSWTNMGRIAAEFVKCSYMGKKRLLSKVVFKNLHFVRAQEEKGQAAIIHTGHFSNWEIFGIAVSALGVKKAVIASGQKNPFINKEITDMRNKFGGWVIDSDDPFFRSIKMLKKGIFLGILSDQSSYQSAVYRKFLGRYCACSPLTPLLSLKLQIPVIPTKLYREGKKFVVEFMDPVYPAPKYSPQEVEKFIDVLNKYYEDWIKENPSDWLWAHNRWKKEKNAPQYRKEHPHG